ncbi:hypothetical protein [Paenibacillus apiarius]|uniref:Uncharacterized protein n=1 Tax=Paenibacillus apiarius TaxID=46240 RepID=A0ABT4DZG2_9BACL|nr:hypothetical protein [Paenibacillus apiarius]MCY9513270.1 hypothetical protein [Paenibacillus apiarius]MCY9521371.1 hypothetical protein [Paenibacillus apiarius]MCY9554483.1 hypothetical protein [Paenibacillus apiarius]MCY9560686.1 hypothetical protein [Paenibacillus apiarius]MCY9685063.1 hypothetical protein [Paenibacillus apiarius]
MNEQRVREIAREEMKNKEATAATVTSEIKIQASDNVDLKGLSDLLHASLATNSHNLIGK